MRPGLIRILAFGIVMMLCLPMVACDMLSGGLVGELLGLVSDTVDSDQLSEDISQVLDSIPEDFTMPSIESVDPGIPTPDTTDQDNVIENTVVEDPTVEQNGPEQIIDDGLEYLSHGDGTCSVISMGTCTDTEIVIPSQISNGDVVVRIESSAFAYLGEGVIITSVTIPDTVTEIGYYAFYSCIGLTEIAIPDSVTKIDGSFVGCRNLTSIVLPKSLTSITGEAFACCDNLNSITVAEGNTTFHSVDNCVVETATNTLVVGCQTSIIPDYITSIAGRAFYNCFGLTSVDIPDGVTSIGEYAFIGCDGVTYSKNGVWYVDEWVVGCDLDVVSADISDAKGIVGNAFYGCSKLSSIILPDSVTTLVDFAFGGCSNLSSITLPSGLTSVGAFAFDGCSGLTSITLPDSVTDIGNFAFRGCTGLRSVTILNKQVEIGGFAFNDCLEVTDVYFAGTKQEWTECGGANNFENATIHYYYTPEE